MPAVRQAQSCGGGTVSRRDQSWVAQRIRCSATRAPTLRTGGQRPPRKCFSVIFERAHNCALVKLRHSVTALQAFDLRVTILFLACRSVAYPLKLLVLRCDDPLMATVSVSKVKQRCLR